MTKKELKKYIKENMFNKNKQWKSTAYFKHIEKDLNILQLEGNTFKEKLYLFYNNKSPKICECGNTTKFVKLSQGYRDYCSVKCSSNSKEKKDKIKATVKERYGVDYITQTDKHKKAVKENYLNKLKDDKFNNEIVEKRIKTNIKRYGVKNVMNDKTIMEKVLYKKKVLYIKKITEQFKDILIPLFNVNNFNGKSSLNKWQCKLCGNIIEDHLNNYRTPRCYSCFPIHKPVSLLEKEITKWVKSLNINNIIENDKQVIKPKELDIYIPDYNLAIEFDGLYWHSELHGKDKNYHLNKTIECEKQGIQLIHIFEDEWLNKQDIVKNIIKIKLGLIDKKLYARKCIIKELENKDTKDFYNNNHIQGYVASKVNIGLYYDEKLVSCLSFAKSRFNKKYNWEITRYVNKLNTSIIGGFAKMLKYFTRKYRGSIITYSDRRLFNGEVYKNNGFKQLVGSNPGYYYTQYNNRQNRQNFMKHKLEDKLEIYDPSLTEWENMQLNGWDRIWDVGNYKFILNSLK